MAFKFTVIFASLFYFIGFSAWSSHKSEQKTLVLVHGAHLTKESFWSLQAALLERNVSSIAIDLPGRNGDTTDPKTIDLTMSAQSLCFSLVAQTGKKIVLGHSQAGAIINQALGICSQQIDEEIIYLAAVVPMPGENVFQGLSELDSRKLLSSHQAQ